MEKKTFFVLCRKRHTILFIRNPKRKRNCRRTDSCCLFEISFQLLQQYFVFLFGVIFHILIYYAYISIKNNVSRTSHSPYFSKSSFDLFDGFVVPWNELKFRLMAPFVLLFRGKLKSILQFVVCLVVVFVRNKITNPSTAHILIDY